MTDASEGKCSFFISYNRADQTWAEWIAWQLEEAGYSVIVQAWDFRPGQNFVLEMDRAVRTAERTIIVLSPHFLTSRFTPAEWAAAFARDPTGEERLLVPVRVAACDPQGLLGPIAYIDLVGREEAKAVEALLVGLKPRGKPDAPPPYPQGATSRTEARTIEKPTHFPGALPPIWNVPDLRNPHFTGRDELLETLHRTLTAGPTALTALSGMGGIGKTQMALEYAYRHQTEFDLVWWLRGEASVTLLADYAALAGELQLPEAAEPELATVARAVRRALERRDRWLLVFDNVPQEDVLRDLLPQGGGRILITSRNPAWDRATPLEVPLLARPSSVVFLLKRTGQGDKAAAVELAVELGDLPLALEQAAAFVVRQAIMIAEYLALFRARREELWRKEKPPWSYPDTVRTTWTLAVARLRQEEPAAVALLTLGAFLAPEAIPRRLFTEHRDVLPLLLSEAASDALRWGDLVEALRSYSLVGVADGSLTFHRLVQAATQDGLSADERRCWAEAAVRVVSAALPDPLEHTNWPVIGTLLPHALAVAGAAERLEVGLQEAAEILNATALYHWARAAWAEAEPLFRKVLEISERVRGAEHPDTATVLNNLALVLRDMGQHAEAEPLLRKALEIGECNPGREHPDFAMRLSNLASLLWDMEQHAEAEPLFREALEISERVRGAEHPDTATVLNNLALVLRDMGQHAEAEPLFREVLKIRVAAGAEHPDTATALNNWALVLRDMAQYAEAESLYQRALEIREKVLGSDHPDTATVLNNLAGLHRVQGQPAMAESLYQRALKIRKTVLGAEHPNTAISRINLTFLYKDQGQYARTEPLLQCALSSIHKVMPFYQRALEIREKVLGSDHPDTVRARYDLEWLRRETK
jgi:tetratricopeptide (TPR) repeat protein